MSGDLSGKPIAITGASSGIGRATALACAREGMPVVVTARRADRLADLVSEIEREGGRAHAVVGDIGDPAVGRRVVEETVERFGSIFAVFANAGYGVEGAAHTLDLEEHRGIFDVNYFGTLHVVLPAVERMLEAGEGRVIICSSCLSHFPLAHYGAYCATKAAQHHLGRSMNQELRGTGVTATTIHPVGTRTEFFEQASERSRAAALVDRSLEKSMQSPEEAARAVMKALRRPRPEVWLSQPTRLGMIFSMLLRRATDAVVRRLVAHRRRRVEHSSGKNAPG